MNGYTLKVRTIQTVLLSVGLPISASMNSMVAVVAMASVVFVRIIGLFLAYIL